jgi:hypothetical protein
MAMEEYTGGDGNPGPERVNRQEAGCRSPSRLAGLDLPGRAPAEPGSPRRVAGRYAAAALGLFDEGGGEEAFHALQVELGRRPWRR